jgi:hypothetical protein
MGAGGGFSIKLTTRPGGQIIINHVAIIPTWSYLSRPGINLMPVSLVAMKNSGPAPKKGSTDRRRKAGISHREHLEKNSIK